MPDPILVEQAELAQFLLWLRDIEEAVGYIENIEEEPFDCLDQCKYIRKTLNKIRGMLTVLL
jgi:hypothetical protein